MHVCVCVDIYMSIRTVRQLLWILPLVLVGSLYTPTVTKPADLSIMTSKTQMRLFVVLTHCSSSNHLL